MGEMADFALDQLHDEDEFGLNGFDKVTIDPDTGEVISCNQRKELVCWVCKSKNLHWRKTKFGWRTHEDSTGKMHVCQQFRQP